MKCEFCFRSIEQNHRKVGESPADPRPELTIPVHAFHDLETVDFAPEIIRRAEA